MARSAMANIGGVVKRSIVNEHRYFRECKAGVDSRNRTEQDGLGRFIKQE